MNKKILVTTFLTAVIAGTWIFQANKFEKEYTTFSSRYLPFGASKYLPVEITYDNVAIEKYKFKILYNKVKIHSNTVFPPIYSDQISVQKLPFIEKERVKIRSTAGSDKPEGVTTGLYAPNHNVAISISRSPNKTDSKDFDIKSIFGKLKLVDIETDSEIINFDDYKIELARHSEISNDNRYSFSYKSDGKNIGNFEDFKLFTLNRLLKLLLGSNNNLNINDMLPSGNKDVFSKLNELKGKENSETTFTAKYNQSLLNNVESLQRNTGIGDILTFFALLNEDVSIESNSKVESAISKNHTIFNLNNQDLVRFNFKSNTDLEIDTEKKKRLAELSADYFQKYINRELSRYFNKKSATNPVALEISDLIGLQEIITNIRNINIDIDVDFTKSTKILNHLATIQINNLKMKYDGNYDSTTYKSQLKIASASELLKNIIEISETGILPIMQKVNTVEEVKKFENMINFLKKHGLSTLSVFNQNGELKEGEDLIINFEVSSNNIYQPRINGKSYEELLMDERIHNMISYYLVGKEIQEQQIQLDIKKN